MIEPAASGAARRAFLRLPYALYRHDPAFVPPLLEMEKERLDPARNAFFGHAEVETFLCRTGGRPSGRVSLQLDREEERLWGVRGATFGLFEAGGPGEAAELLAHAESWARARGARRLRGPFSLSINQESGLLVEGFDSPPMLLMPHNRREYGGWIEAAGLAKARDLNAWRMFPSQVPPAFRRAADKARVQPGRALRVRPVEVGELRREVEIVRQVFNSAWAGNWGFLPMTDGEVAAMARDLRLLIDPRIALVAEADGEPVGIAIGLPNLNEAIADLDGRLFPLGWARLLWRLKVRGLRGGRLALFGVRGDWRGVDGLGLTALLLCELYDRAAAAGYTGEWELSWVLEDNRAATRAARAVGGRLAKVYRVYEKELG